MSRLLVFAYGVISYLVFFVTYLYAIGFVGNLVVPKSLDSAPTAPLATALLINLGLLALFATQHSVMARPAFKRRLLRLIPAAAERSTYVLASSLALILLFWQWSPLGGVVWDIQDPVARAALYAAFGFGWLLVLVTTFLINHFDLFGLRQVWLYLLDREYTPLHFVTPGPYRLVRHPLYLGWLFAFWATPTMTVTHLLFAVMTTAYIFVAIQLEERDLVDAHPEYAEYRRRVPMIVPVGTRRLPETVRTASAIAVFVLIGMPVFAQAPREDHRVIPPSVPPNLEVPQGYRAFLVGHAIGTQNYICAPAPTASGVDWLAIGPQATVFDRRFEQVLTHFASKNPYRGDAIQATWQHSRDTSAVWATRLSGSFDPNYVAPDAIEWLLLEVTGTEFGPTGGDKLASATFIQRVNTVGGLRPPAGECTPGTVNSRRLVYYEADYYFYR